MKSAILTVLIVLVSGVAFAQQYYDPYAAESASVNSSIDREIDSWGRSPFGR